MTATVHLGDDRWIRRLTTGSVVVLAGIAAVVSYRHMHALALAHGEVAWTAALIPLSVDGMIVASSMSLLLDSRCGVRRGSLPWVLLLAGSAASLAANVAVAEPSVYGRVIAAWPSLALIGAYELLMRQIRNQPQRASSAARSVSTGAGPAASQRTAESASGPASPGPQVTGPVQRQRHAPTRRNDNAGSRMEAALLEQARQVDADHWAKTGRPASAETLRIRLRIGAATARALKDQLRHDARPAGATVTLAPYQLDDLLAAT